VRAPHIGARSALPPTNWHTQSGRSVGSLVLVLITACDLIFTCSARFILSHPRKHMVSLCTEFLWMFTD
jgi:hypothetical protein